MSLGALSYLPMSHERIAILIDGGHLRVLSKQATKRYDNALIESVALHCKIQGEEIHRILYYDCAPYKGSAKLPVSGQMHDFKGSDLWLAELSRKDLFAVRRGVLKFRGWKVKSVPVSPASLQDSDFAPVFEQKGVDMRIGLDIALFSQTHSVNRIVLISNDTDCVAALKFARRAGLQIVLVALPNSQTAPELLAHADFKREIPWP